jgi:DNA repair exonuclease SbcCD ATPase subunit
MKESLITCPHCGQEFELSDALTGKIREHLNAELQQDVVRREADLHKKLSDLKEREEKIAEDRDALEEQIQNGIKQRLKEIEEKATKKVEDKYTDQLKELQDNLKERDEAIAAFREQERELRKKQRQLEKLAVDGS